MRNPISLGNHWGATIKKLPARSALEIIFSIFDDIVYNIVYYIIYIYKKRKNVI
jgi:hypothetical protein